MQILNDIHTTYTKVIPIFVFFLCSIIFSLELRVLVRPARQLEPMCAPLVGNSYHSCGGRGINSVATFSTVRSYFILNEAIRIVLRAIYLTTCTLQCRAAANPRSDYDRENE